MATFPQHLAMWALLAVMPFSGQAAQPTAIADPGLPLDELDEARVTGEQPGPAMWKVSKGDHTLWIMGTFHPLPAGMKWRSRQAEEVIARSGEIIAPSTTNVGLNSMWTGVRNLRAILRLRFNADGSTLREVLPPELYMRWHAAHRRWFGEDPDPKERARPGYAALLLYGQALSESDLVQRPVVWQRVTELAKLHKVRVRRREFSTTIGNRQTRQFIAELAALRRDEEAQCLAEALDYIDTELPKIRRRAQAWAVGDVAALRALPVEATLANCGERTMRSATALRELVDRQRAQSDQDWAGIIDWALLAHPTSFTALPIDSLLDPAGLLAKLRAKGYTVEEPQ